MPDALDIKKVISTSTASVSIDDLSKKGFKQVKVLNQAVITRLIGEAVDRVLEAKSREISKEEREKVIHEARSHFETLARERLEKERSRIEELKHSNQDLESESTRTKRELSELHDLFAKKKVEVIGLQADLQAKTAEVERLKAQLASAEPKSDALVEKILTAVNQKLQTTAQPAEVQKIMLSLDTLSRRLSNVSSMGGGGGADMGDPETLKDFVLESLFDKEKGAGVETNVSKVKVKQSKAGDVKGALAKLKKLQKGGEDG
jgi:chromosome segregation ATPase